MNSFEDLNLSSPMLNALSDLGFTTPTPVQSEAYRVVLSGKDMVGVAQTGTGKTLAYMLPILQGLKFSKQIDPKVLVIVPTRELVLQVVERTNEFAKYMNVRAMGVYGGVNINTQKIAVAEGMDVLVATPGRLYDLVVSRALQLKAVRKLVIDEVDVMLDLGFRHQLTNIFELLSDRRQNMMFSATMTEEVDALIDDFFIKPTKISIAVSGTRLDNISQSCFEAPNFYTKLNLLSHLLKDKEEYSKVLVFISTKKNADKVFEMLEENYGPEMCIIHSNKSQNYRIRSISQFDEGVNRILIATDVMARGLDLDRISHVINFDTPAFPENYMHRIGRTGRAEELGQSLLFTTPKELDAKAAIESLMDYQIPLIDFPDEVEVSEQLLPEERDEPKSPNKNRNTKIEEKNSGFHEKSLKNQKTNQGGSYKRIIEKKYKKPRTRGNKPVQKRGNRK